MNLRNIFLATFVVVLQACTIVQAPKVDMPVQPPQSARMAAIHSAPPPQANGSIYQVASSRGLFEDRRARTLGDTLTITIDERLSAKQSSGSTVDRTAKADGSITAVPFLKTVPGILGRMTAGGSSSNTFEGKGSTNKDNTFAGSITVVVTEVLPNGNLVVAGEKQVGINQNVEVLQFAGIVNPVTILPNNSVSSTQVADARLQVRGRGDQDRSQSVGWLQRFFMSIAPI